MLLQTQLIKGLSDKAVEECHEFLSFLLLFKSLPTPHLPPLQASLITPLQHPYLKHPLLDPPPASTFGSQASTSRPPPYPSPKEYGRPTEGSGSKVSSNHVVTRPSIRISLRGILLGPGDSAQEVGFSSNSWSYSQMSPRQTVGARCGCPSF